MKKVIIFVAGAVIGGIATKFGKPLVKAVMDRIPKKKEEEAPAAE